MKKIIIILVIFISTSSTAQQNENLSIGAGFAHFDDTDGFEVNMGYYSTINRYLGLEVKMNYAKTNDFPNIYRFSEQINQNYWFSKSSIFNITPNLHVVFIEGNKHHFSLYTGIGLMLLDTADNTNFITNPNEFNFESTVESYSTLSKTIGIKYTYYINNHGFGFDAKLISPLKNNEDYFGQDNFRTIGLFITKRF
jgi:hypothetical protein